MRKLTTKQRRLIREFLDKRAIDENQLRQVMDYYESGGENLDEILIKVGGVDEKTFLKVAAAHYGTKFVNLEKLQEAVFSKDILEKIPVESAKRHNFFPVAYDSKTKTITVITPDVNSMDTEMEIKKAWSGGVRFVNFYVATSKATKHAIAKWYGSGQDSISPMKKESSPPVDKMLSLYGGMVIGEDTMAKRSKAAIKVVAESEPEEFTCVHCGGLHPAKIENCPGTGKIVSPAHKFAFTLLEGKYRTGGMVKEGGMGVIYEGKHVEIGKKLAIKFLNPLFCDSQESYKRFKIEAKAAAAIAHKNIVRVFDIGTAPGGIPYIVMEYLAGEDLAARLEKSKWISLGYAVEILDQILEALGAVHAGGIVHRDLKPGNIFLAEQSGGSEIVKLLDFGVARFARKESESLTITKDGQVFGTPCYASPEQIADSSKVDHRTDLYSAGVIFYEMVTGKVPFQASAYPELLSKIRNGDYIDPGSYVPDLPGSVKDFIETGISKDPEARFHSSQEMLSRLRDISTAIKRMRLVTGE